MTATKKTDRQHAEEVMASGMRCNCDLDNWEPEASTGHSCVCRIHKAATERAYNESFFAPATPAA